MEVMHCVLVVCLVAFVCPSEGVDYYYPPVYGTKPQVKTNLKQQKSQGVSYYYPPVYGKITEEEYVPVYSASTNDQSDHEQKTYSEERPSYEHRTERKTSYKPTKSYKVPGSSSADAKFKLLMEGITSLQDQLNSLTSHRSSVSSADYISQAKSPKKENTERTYSDNQEQHQDYFRQPGKKSYPMKKTLRKCLQCEYSPPKPIHYEVLVREPEQVRVPREIEECEWEKDIEYIYIKPRRGSKQMYGKYKEVPKYTKNCFPKTIYETKTIYHNRYVKKQRMSQSGGFEPCKGPLDAYSAQKYGVDDWDCENNCYVRQDKSGTITRGCYSGQYKVDPDRLGCHYQGEKKQDLYCFCQDDHCNGKSVASSNPNNGYDK